MNFAGKTAIVTGASRGIGLSIAERLVAEGARVMITARNQDALEAAVARLGGPAVARAVAGKVDDVNHQAETVAAAVEAFGSVDLLVNNTGINPVYGPMVELELGAARKIFEVNCLAALSWVQHAYQAWMHDHGGAVVNIASHSAVQPASGVGFYGASKAMLIAITKSLALELGPSIRVNAVAPAVVKTAFAAALYEDDEEQMAATYPLKRLGEPGDVAAAVAYLLSDDAAWVTGHLLLVDGGMTIGGPQ
ncbi:SDR family oxidoreductase [Subtercola lobariae]|nr:SDR family oxidoreductase [Subtercola lobariae]